MQDRRIGLSLVTANNTREIELIGANFKAIDSPARGELESDYGGVCRRLSWATHPQGDDHPAHNRLIDPDLCRLVIDHLGLATKHLADEIAQYVIQ